MLFSKTNEIEWHLVADTYLSTAMHGDHNLIYDFAYITGANIIILIIMISLCQSDHKTY